MRYNVLIWWFPHAGNVEIGQVVIALIGLRYSWLNMREVWLDFRACFDDRARPLLDFCFPRRWRHEATKERLTARANVMSECIKTAWQIALFVFGLWTWTTPPPPPSLVREIHAQAQHFGPELLGLELMVILCSLQLLVHSIHERRARLAIDLVPFRRRVTDQPLPQFGDEGEA